MNSERPNWDEYFMKIAHLVATRSTCMRRKVGAVLVKDKRMLVSGYNGAPQSLRHCEQAGCLRQKLNIPSGERHEICRGLHAEQNAIIQGAVFGVQIKGAALYSTHQPCILCAKMLINAGVQKIIYSGGYPDDLSLDMIREAGITLCQMDLGDIST